jgi:hypothetical protein
MRRMDGEVTKTKTKFSYPSDVALRFCVYLIQRYVSKTIGDLRSCDMVGLSPLGMCFCGQEHTQRSHDQTRSIRIYSDAVFAEFDGWSAVAYSILTENGGHLPADCVNPRTAK